MEVGGASGFYNILTMLLVIYTFTANLENWSYIWFREKIDTLQIHVALWMVLKLDSDTLKKLFTAFNEQSKAERQQAWALQQCITLLIKIQVSFIQDL